MIVITYGVISVVPPSLLVDAYLVNKYQAAANDVLHHVKAAIPDANSKFGLGVNRLDEYLPSPMPAGLERARAYVEFSRLHPWGYVLLTDQVRCTLPPDSDVTTCVVQRESK
jgi:hypothetical protein